MTFLTQYDIMRQRGCYFFSFFWRISQSLSILVVLIQPFLRAVWNRPPFSQQSY